MQVTIFYMSQLQKAAGVSREVMAVNEPCTVQTLITNEICPRRTQLKEKILDDNGGFRLILLVFVGDKQVDINSPFDLNEGDEVTIMFPISGG